jgi:hypothetical protein
VKIPSGSQTKSRSSLLDSQESFTRDVPKPKRRLIKEALSGIQATKDVKLSNIIRSLNEQRSLIKTEDRLSRNLSDVGFIDGMKRQIGRLGASKVRKKMVIASIGVRNKVFLVLAVRFCPVCVQQNLKLKLLVERILLVSERFFEVPFVFNDVITQFLT